MKIKTIINEIDIFYSIFNVKLYMIALIYKIIF